MLQNSFSLEIEEEFLTHPKDHSPLVNSKNIYFRFKFWEKYQFDVIKVPSDIIIFNELTYEIHKRWVKSDESYFTFKY